MSVEMALRNLIEVSTNLYQEFRKKNFDRDNGNSYLTCFINVGKIDDFMSAVEELAEEFEKEDAYDDN